MQAIVFNTIQILLNVPLLFITIKSLISYVSSSKSSLGYPYFRWISRSFSSFVNSYLSPSSSKALPHSRCGSSLLIWYSSSRQWAKDNLISKLVIYLGIMNPCLIIWCRITFFSSETTWCKFSLTLGSSNKNWSLQCKFLSSYFWIFFCSLKIYFFLSFCVIRAYLILAYPYSLLKNKIALLSSLSLSELDI